MHNLSDTIERKFIESYNVNEWEIETDTGWSPIKSSHKTIEYQEYILTTASGKQLIAAADHILFDQDMNEIFVKDCVPDVTRIQTKQGLDTVISVVATDNYSNMYDLEVDDNNHRYYGNDILSHNTTTIASYILWYVIFNKTKNVAILANTGDTAQEILKKIQDMYEYLPKWLQQGVIEWNKRSVEFENKSRILTGPCTKASIRGKTIQFMLIDESAFVENWDEFYISTFNTMANSKKSKIAMVSTPNGMNHFAKFWEGAVHKDPAQRNGWQHKKVVWSDVPGRDEAWKQEILAATNFDYEKFDQEHECIFEDAIISLKCKFTGEIFNITIKEAYELMN